jgi:hypothetical protein
MLYNGLVKCCIPCFFRCSLSIDANDQMTDCQEPTRSEIKVHTNLLQRFYYRLQVVSLYNYLHIYAPHPYIKQLIS